jgi:hypothetical protein
MDILLKSISYFKVNNLYLHASVTGIKPLPEKYFEGLQFGHPPFDLLYLPGPNRAILEKTGQNAVYHNDTLCIMDHIHANPNAIGRWDAVKSMVEARITIDCFHCGLVFFRKEQAAQHFSIRI